MTDVSPLSLDFNSQSATGKAVYMLGHPLGMPMMLTRNGSIQKADGTTFEVDLDAFAGNSGSPVFSKEEGKVIGVLVAGREDFHLTVKEGKRVLQVNRITPEMVQTGGYERVQVVENAIFRLFHAMSDLIPSLKKISPETVITTTPAEASSDLLLDALKKASKFPQGLFIKKI